MSFMAKKQKPPEEAGKRYPSRENTRYIGLPLNLYQALERFAQDKSTDVDEKSVSWAARVLLREALLAHKLWPPPETTG